VHVAQVASHAAQVRSAVELQTAVWYWPAGHAPEQATQVLPLRYVPGSQLPQAAGPAPVHVAQLASQAEHTRSAVVEQADAWYWPDGHAPEQARHAPPLRYVPEPQLVHAVMPCPEHVVQLA
jgi:hypothetical protein